MRSVAKTTYISTCWPHCLVPRFMYNGFHLYFIYHQSQQCNFYYFHHVCVCVYHHGKTSSLESTTVVGVTTEEVLRTLWSVIRCLSVSVCCGQICDFNSVTDRHSHGPLHVCA